MPTFHLEGQFGGAFEAGLQVALGVDTVTIASARDVPLVFIAEELFKDAGEGSRVVDGSEIASFEDCSHAVDLRRNDRQALGHRFHHGKGGTGFPA